MQKGADAMWRESESEVVRLEKVLAHNDLTGQALLEKFRGASRESVRLAAALRGYFTSGSATEDQRELYGSYLRSRVRPTVAALMEENRVTELERFEKEAPFSQALVDEFLAEAMEMDRPEITVWLLQCKKERFGFRDRDFSW